MAEDLKNNNKKVLLKIYDNFELNKNNSEGTNKLKEEVCI